MKSIKALLKPNTRIFLGVILFIITMVYIADRLMNNLEIRLFDLVSWFAMFTTGAISIIEGLRIKKNIP